MDDRLRLVACLVIVGCNPTAGTDDAPGTAGEATDGTTSPGVTSTTGEHDCPDSDFPEPFCYKGNDIADALGDASFRVVGSGHLGPDGSPALLLAQPTSLHLASWDVRAQMLQIVIAAQGPDGAQWDGGPYLEWSPAIVTDSSQGRDDVVLLHAGSFWHFQGGAGTLGTPVLSPASYEDEVDWTWSAERILDAGDLDGDGQSDLVVATGKSVQIWRREPSGWQAWGPRFPHQFYPSDAWPVCPSPRAARAADLDRDGRVDVVLVNESGCSVQEGYVERPFVTVLRNTDGTPEGLSPTHAEHGIAAGATFLEVGDLDGDGALDIIVGANLDITHQGGPGPIRAMKGVGDGTFEDSIELLADALGIGVVDLDNDGSVELLVVPYGDGVGGFHVLDGLGPSSSMTLLPAVDVLLESIGDINADGVPDLAPLVLTQRDNKHLIYTSIR